MKYVIQNTRNEQKNIINNNTNLIPNVKFNNDHHAILTLKR